MAYAEYNDYKFVYFGIVIPEADFGRLAERASEYIDHVTFNRLKDNTGVVQDEVIKCNCALAELIYKYEQTAEAGKQVIKSESVGDYSVQYASTNIEEYGKKKDGIVKQYLAHTGLLYRGW